MAIKTVDVRARISEKDKEKASQTLEAMGLTVSQAIRLFLNDVADTGSLPFSVKVPNQETIEAMAEADQISKSQQKGFNSSQALLDSLNSED